MTVGLDAISSLALVVLLGGTYLADYLRTEEPDPYSVEGAQKAYQEDEISHAEMERRLEVAFDDEADRIREVVEPISGIGPELSRTIAAHFDSLDELHAASREELESIPGVGEQYAAAISDRLS